MSDREKLLMLLQHDDFESVASGYALLCALCNTAQDLVLYLGEWVEDLFQIADTLSFHRIIKKNLKGVHQNIVALLLLHFFEKREAEWVSYVDFFTLKNKELALLSFFDVCFHHVKMLEIKDAQSLNEIHVFPNLEHINVGYSSLKTLPNEISQLKRLRIIRLRGTLISHIPTGIRALELDAKQWIKYQKEICAMTQLKHLFLAECGLTELPDAIGNISTLERLRLSNNKITALPETMIQLTNLKILFLHKNKLTEFPTLLQDLPNLSHIDLSQNPLHTLPSTLEASPKLERVGMFKTLIERDSLSFTRIDISTNIVGRRARIIGVGQVYSTINRNKDSYWPSEEICMVAGKDGWGDFYPKNDMEGIIVAILQKEMVLLKINIYSNTYYVPIAYDGLHILERVVPETKATAS